MKTTHLRPDWLARGGLIGAERTARLTAVAGATHARFRGRAVGSAGTAAHRRAVVRARVAAIRARLAAATPRTR